MGSGKRGDKTVNFFFNTHLCYSLDFIFVITVKIDKICATGILYYKLYQLVLYSIKYQLSGKNPLINTTPIRAQEITD